MDLDSWLLWVVVAIVVLVLGAALLGLFDILDNVARVVVRVLLRRFIRDLLF